MEATINTSQPQQNLHLKTDSSRIVNWNLYHSYPVGPEVYSKAYLKQPLKENTKIGFQYRL